MATKSILTALTLSLLMGPVDSLLAEEAELLPAPQAIVIEQVIIQQAEPVAEKAAVAQKAEQKADAKPADKATGEEAEKKKEADEAELRKQMRELELQLQQKRTQFQEQVNKERQQAEQKGRQALKDIKLPRNPTRTQVEDYIAALRKATEGRRSFSSSDPAVDKLKKVPAEHFDLLMTEMSNRTTLRYYANYAIREIDPEEIRKKIVASFPDNPNSIGVIVMHGWCEDVRPHIVEHIKSADSSLSIAWFQAAVEIDEPSLYPKLHEVTIGSRYASQFITMLKTLPEYDLSHTINTCWERASTGKLSVSTSSFAHAAAQRGNVDALGVLISQIQRTSSYMVSSSAYNANRVNVLGLIDHRGSNKDLQAWFKANKDELVFDELRGRFVLPEGF